MSYKIVMCVLSFASTHLIWASAENSSNSSSSSVPATVSAPQGLTNRQKIELVLNPDSDDINAIRQLYSNNLNVMENWCASNPSAQEVLNASSDVAQACLSCTTQLSLCQFLCTCHPQAYLQSRNKFEELYALFKQKNENLSSLQGNMPPTVAVEYERGCKTLARNRAHIHELEKKELERKLKVLLYQWKNERASLEAENARLRAQLAQSSSSSSSSVVVPKIRPELHISIPENTKFNSKLIVQLD